MDRAIAWTFVLGTDFANLRDVNVVVTPYKAEIQQLQEKADSLQ